MANIKKSLAELIGKTPLLELTNYNKNYKLKAKIVAKLEYFNPLGSVKDRVGEAMIADAQRQGLINRETTIIEPTSGNTGIGLACACAIRRMNLILTMPDTMSVERRSLLKSLGAEIILTDGTLGMSGAIKKAEDLASSIPNSFIPQQFENLSNPQIHRETTAIEILDDTDDSIDFFVAGVGTGGTITGVGEVLKQYLKDIKIIAVEPAASAVLSGCNAGPHKLQGIGAGFIPKILNTSILDEIIPIHHDAAFRAAREVGKSDGLLIGISSGAALCAATQLALRNENKGKTIVVLFPDSGERYLSTSLFGED